MAMSMLSRCCWRMAQFWMRAVGILHVIVNFNIDILPRLEIKDAIEPRPRKTGSVA